MDGSQPPPSAQLRAVLLLASCLTTAWDQVELDHLHFPVATAASAAATGGTADPRVSHFAVASRQRRV